MSAQVLRMRRLARGLAAAICAATTFSLPVGATAAQETDLKPAYAYNFMVLSTWPADAPPGLRFCVAGTAADFAGFQVLAGKAVRDRAIGLVHVAAPQAAVECSVLYVAASEVRRLGTWLAAVANLPILTITEGVPGGGAVANLRVAGRQIVFDLDTQAAAAARIQLSSQLIKLAATRR